MTRKKKKSSGPTRYPERGAPRRWIRKLLVVALPLPFLWLTSGHAKAESRTAESIWSESDAQQRAIEQIPVKDRAGISQTRCQEIGVGRMGSLPRFRCSVWFEPTPSPTGPASPSTP